MVTQPKQSDKKQLYNLWKTIFAHQDGGSINYFFNELFSPEDFYVIKDVKEDLIVCGLLKKSATLSLNGELFNVSILDNLFTLYKYRNQGLISTLLIKVLDELSYHQLFTLIKTSAAKDFSKLGFKPLYFQKRYLIKREDLFNVDGYSLSNYFDISELKTVYDKFMDYFNGYFVKAESDFKTYVEMLRASGKEIYVTRNQSQEIYGYIVYDYVESKLIVSDLVYLDSTALLTLLNQAMGINPFIYVDVSENENLGKVIPNLTYKERNHLMIRINDKKLFKRYFNVEDASVKRVIKNNFKPLHSGFI